MAVPTAKSHAVVRHHVKRLIQFVTRIYFSRIEVRGAQNLPRATAIFAGNHPSGLLDPMVLMTALPDVPMSSVAKHSLFSAPVVGFFMKVMQAVPVVQAFDVGLDPSKQMSGEERRRVNAAMFDTVRQRLVEDHTSIAIFPEGTCHSTPQVKELKLGTARMALEVASSGGPRIPIVPVGLSYSDPSASRFRGWVLVDIGKPIEITDELLHMYQHGSKEDKVEAQRQVTDCLEDHLRNVTINVPDWVEQLQHVCQDRGWHAPVFQCYLADELPLHGRAAELDPAQSIVTGLTPMGTSKGGPSAPAHQTKAPRRRGMPRRSHQVVTVSVNGRLFASSVARESPADAHRRAHGRSTRMPNDLRRAAASAAFFALAGGGALGAAAADDADFVQTMHLARRVYKPHGVELTLSEYAALTRNFVAAALEHAGDPRFHRVWASLTAYRRAMRDLGVTDKAVAEHDVGSDVDGTRLAALRQSARRSLLHSAWAVPLAVLGTVTHAPIAALCIGAGRFMGVTDDGDRSVEATMRVVAGLVGVGATYPLAGAAAAWATGSALAAVPAVALMGLSGYLAAVEQPARMALRGIAGRLRVLTKDDNVDGLRLQRRALADEVRAFADEVAPPGLSGWWRDPAAFRAAAAEHAVESAARAARARLAVTAAQIEAAGLQEYTIQLSGASKRHAEERAVLTVRQVPGNSRALLWIPGRNDSFFHVHVLDRLLDAGFDVFALDLRRCGRAKYSARGEQLTADDMAHDSYDFEEYFEELDAALRFLKTPAALPTDGTLQHGGCGRVYESIVMYAHSTGGLVAALYGAPHGGAWRGAVDGFVFNSPFWSWNLPWYSGVVVKHAFRAGVEPGFVIQQGGDESEYSTRIRETYEFPAGLKSERTLTTTAGWCRAVTEVQTKLKKGQLHLQVPTLVLSTEADTVLARIDIDELSDNLTEGPQDGSSNDGTDRPIFSRELVERVVHTTPDHPSAHDLLAAPSQKRVDEAMGHVLRWLGAHFPVV